MGRKAIPFWDNVRKSDGCWEWVGGRRGAGYGRTFIHRKPVATHRLSWEMANGPIPAGMQVLHRCDNPPCLRPDHLFLGTQIDNLRDMTAKGRRAVGDRHPSHLHPSLRQGENQGAALLTNAAVLDIRQRHAAGWKRGDLTAAAKEYGVTKQTIWGVVHRTSWRHI